MIYSKSRLAIELSKLKVFDQPMIMDEQYPTDSEVAAEMLWYAHYQDDIIDKTIADFGAGTGILGIGALLIGAKKVHFIDTDDKALEICKENLKQYSEVVGDTEILHKDVQEFNEKVDVVIQNPPFGTRKKHADRDFLMKAFEIAPVIYSFHKTTSENFLKKIAEDNNYKITHYWKFNFPIKASQLFHKKKIHRISVGCWRLEKINLDSFKE